MMQQGINTLEIDRMAAPQAQGIETLGSMEDAPMIPNGGIQAAVPDATRMLADAGRYGDIYVVHASEGETVVPKEVLEGPGGQQIRGMLFRQMEQLGVDPQRYVVGNQLNSINPETGLPEFFFKKVFKSIKKIFKKVAPIALPILLSMTGIGAIAAGAIGSGIGTLIQGGDAKDALKAAAFGGVTAGIMSGASGVLTGDPSVGIGSRFMSGVQGALPPGFVGGTGSLPTFGLEKLAGTQPDAPAYQGAFQTPVPSVKPLSDASYPKLRAEATAPGPNLTEQLLNTANDQSSYVARVPRRPSAPSRLIRKTTLPPPSVLAVNADPARFIGGNQPFGLAADQRAMWAANAANPIAAANVSSSPGTIYKAPSIASAGSNIQEMLTATQRVVPKPPGFLGQTANVISGSPSGTENALLYNQELSTALRRFSQVPNLTPDQIMTRAEAVAAQAVKDAQPGLIRQSLPLFAGSYLLASLDDDEESGRRSSFADNPIGSTERYRLFNEQEGVTRPRERPPIGFTDTSAFQFPTDQVQFPTTQLAAHGGEMQNFPPRIGAISGPGTGTSDDVPAMLSDGEFVMTAQAVRGAGNGSRRQGVKNLYDIMRNFEAVA